MISSPVVKTSWRKAASFYGNTRVWFIYERGWKLAVNTHMTRLGSLEREKGSTWCDEVNGQVVRASFMLHSELPPSGVFRSDLFVWFEVKCNRVLRSLVERRK